MPEILNSTPAEPSVCIFLERLSPVPDGVEIYYLEWLAFTANGVVRKFVSIRSPSILWRKPTSRWKSWLAQRLLGLIERKRVESRSLRARAEQFSPKGSWNSSP